MKEIITTGDIVRSVAGHDEERIYLVAKVLSEDFCEVVDGRLRKLGNPKTKRFKHVRKAGREEELLEALTKGDLTDKALRDALKKYRK